MVEIDQELWMKNMHRAVMGRQRRYTVWEDITRGNLEISDRCQGNCVFCFREEFYESHEPTTMATKSAMDAITEVNEFVRQVFDHPLKRVNLGLNGEPLIHWEAPKIVQHLERLKIQSRLSTNALALTSDISSQLLAGGLDIINFSIEATNAFTFEKIRRNLDWITVFNNMHEFYMLRNEGKYKCKIIVNPVSCVENEGQDEAIIKLWSMIADRKPVMCREIPIGRNFRVQPWFGQREKPICMDTFAIKANGDVFACCFDIHGERPLGNIFEQPAAEIYYDDAVKELRRDMLDPATAPAFCKICTSYPQVVDKNLLNEYHWEIATRWQQEDEARA